MYLIVIAYYSAWLFGYTEDVRFSPHSTQQQIQPLLDDPNLVMLFVNQNHNITHPKVISVPRGVLRRNGRLIWGEGVDVLKNGLRSVVIIMTSSF